MRLVFHRNFCRESLVLVLAVLLPWAGELEILDDLTRAVGQNLSDEYFRSTSGYSGFLTVFEKVERGADHQHFKRLRRGGWSVHTVPSYCLSS